MQGTIYPNRSHRDITEGASLRLHVHGKLWRWLPALMLTCIMLQPFGQAKADTTASLAEGDPLALIGIGMYQELRNDIYLGALYGPNGLESVDALRDDAVAKRMSVRFVSNYSNRKLARHWKERMAMNNPRSRWQPFTREIIEFSKLFKREFEAGDEINIDHLPGLGTQVYLNKTLFTTINKPGFVDLLLNVWLGNIPPTKAFGVSIRGKDNSNSDDYLTKYAALQPVVGRFDADKVVPQQVATAETKPASKPVVQKTVAKPPAKKPEKKVVQKPTQTATQPKPAASQQTDTKLANIEKPDVLNDPVNDTAAKKAGSSAVVAKETLKADIKLEDDALKLKQQTAPESKPTKQQVAKLEKPPVKEEDLFDADLITGSYTRDLINAIRQHQEYPRKALERKEQGDVTAKVTIGTGGDIIKVEIIERSGSRILDRAVSKIIKKSGPFEPIPSELKLDQFQFNVPISFRL